MPTWSQSEPATLQILKTDKSATSNSSEVMYTLTVKVTNDTDKAGQFSNNNFAAIDSEGRRYTVTRKRFREEVFLKPGESTTVDRIYFVVDAETRLEWLELRKGKKLGGKVKF